MSDVLYSGLVVVGILSAFGFIGMNLGWFPVMTDISPEYKAWLIQHTPNVTFEPSPWARLNHK